MKYHNRKTIVDGITFDSKAEAERYKELKRLEIMGVIKGLELQKPYRLCKGRWENGKPFSITYKADFVYTLDGETIVEDVKGYRTEAYQLKKKLMRAVYGIEITEVKA
jgi:hypothetical protein